jgi:hypothetical protein
MTEDLIALDRGSVRSVDIDGHMHVALNPISKANVCGYAFEEIPDAAALGLKPGQIYQLYRDPKELAKAAPTFDGKPLLILHKVQSADNHSRDLTVGSVNNAVFQAPYLMAELDIWDGEAIAGIESGEQRELSSGYRYVADMTPGEVGGVRYDGVMRDIVANHIALVQSGRAGADVVVGDSAIQLISVKDEHMATHSLSKSARVASIALDTYLRPKLAKDAKIDLGKILTGQTGKEWSANKPKIKIALDAAVAGKLAKDADITDVIEMLDRLDDVVDEEDVTPAQDEDAETEEERKARMDKRAADKAAKDKAAKDADPDDDKKTPAKDKKAKDADPDDDDDDKKKKNPFAKDAEMISKAAMDAALAVMAKTTESATIARLSAIREAEKVIRPYVGELAMAQDSAEAVYRVALDTLGIETKGLHPDALKQILMAQPKPGDESQRRPVRLAADSASANSEYLKMFPNANRLMGA